MGRFAKGDVVVVPFPFSDLSGSKPRPALVVATLTGNDVILCMITSKNKSDGYSIALNTTDFISGGIHHNSIIRPNRLFTADPVTFHLTAGQISTSKISQVTNKIIEIIS